MNYQTVTVIGLGTLGGFLCKYLSELENTRELIIIDHDIVESKNVFNSIYRFSDVGEYKTNALADIVGNDVFITRITTKYEEGVTKLPRSDLVIDCRDMVCDRNEEIDVRFYISDKTLIIDCRKKVKNTCTYEGSYSIQLTKNEIKKAAYFASQIIDNDHIRNMIKNNMIQKINLDFISSIIKSSIKNSIENKLDMIYDYDNKRNIYCIEENIKPILSINKKKDTKIFVGEKPKNIINDLFLKSPETTYYLVPQNSLKTSLDVINKVNEIIKNQPGVSNFIVTIREIDGEEYVELLEETGAA